MYPDIPDMAGEFLTFDAELENKSTQILIDHGTIISVVKRGFLHGASAPEARLKLKGIVPGETGQQYGPRMVTLSVNGKAYKFPMYEAQMDGNCFLALDFLQGFYCIVDPVKLQMEIKIPYGDMIQLKKPQQQPSISLHIGAIHFTIRISQNQTIQPNETSTCKVNFEADCDVDVPTAEFSPSSATVFGFEDGKKMITSMDASEARSEAPEACSEEWTITLPDGYSDSGNEISRVHGGARHRGATETHGGARHRGASPHRDAQLCGFASTSRTSVSTPHKGVASLHGRATQRRGVQPQ